MRITAVRKINTRIAIALGALAGMLVALASTQAEMGIIATDEVEDAADYTTSFISFGTRDGPFPEFGLSPVVGDNFVGTTRGASAENAALSGNFLNTAGFGVPIAAGTYTLSVSAGSNDIGRDGYATFEPFLGAVGGNMLPSRNVTTGYVDPGPAPTEATWQNVVVEYTVPLGDPLIGQDFTWGADFTKALSPNRFAAGFDGVSIDFLADGQTGSLNRDTTLFGPVTEWSVNNPTFSGNPYDLGATVTFKLDGSDHERKTKMFYDESDTWKFRFTGTQTGTWQFTTSSTDGELNGLTGTVTVGASPDPDPRGFLVAANSKFARQIGETGLKGEVMHVYMNLQDPTFVANPGIGINDQGGWTPVNLFDEPAERAAYIEQATENGMNTIFLHMNAQWFEANQPAADQLSSTNPDPTTFRALEEFITDAREAEVQVMIWAWADDARKWTPNFGPLDGQNGSADRRLQRYIAARLGPLPGWSMSYGFDLDEWATEAEVQSWAAFLNDEMGWPHLLWARERSNSDMSAVSNDFRPDGNPADEFYQLAVAELDASQGRPVIFERRFAYLRDGVWTDEKTRRAMWQFTIAGGAAGWFGFFPGSIIADPGPYSNPEELRTHAAFWKDRLLVDMERQNGLTPDNLAWALATPDFGNIVIYAMDTDEIQLNLSGLANPFFAILVDTETGYAEINLGILSPSNQTLDLSSFGQARDWALVLTEVLPGDFDLDGDVDGADFLKWQREGLGASALTLWNAQFGGTNTPPAATGVPEPSSVGILLLGILITLGAPRRGQNVMK